MTLLFLAEGKRLKKNSQVLFSALLALSLLAGCATGGDSSGSSIKVVSPLQTEGNRTVNFMAHAVIYHIASTPKINERSFKSRVTVDKRPSITSYKFENFVTGQGKSDNSVILAISGDSGGLGIYDWSGAPLIEYSQGKVNGSVITFKRQGKSGKTYARWIIGDAVAISQIDTFNVDNVLIHSEITTYQAQ